MLRDTMSGNKVPPDGTCSNIYSLSTRRTESYRTPTGVPGGSDREGRARFRNLDHSKGDLIDMKRALSGLAILALTLPALAAAETWEIDSAHSTVSYKIRHMLSNLTGSFGTLSGTIEFDPENPAAGSVEVTIPVSSIETHNEKRNAHLQSEDFFDAANHPNLTFKSTKFVQTDDGLKVEGVLNMRGVDKPVTLDVEYLGMMGDVAGFSVSTKLNRQDWGISWNRALDNGALLGDDVTVQIEIEAKKKAA